jgi:hypothetical protein
MLDALNRAELYRDLAEECRRLATTTISKQMRNRYLLMANDYSLLAIANDYSLLVDVEEQELFGVAHRN